MSRLLRLAASACCVLFLVAGGSLASSIGPAAPRGPARPGAGEIETFGAPAVEGIWSPAAPSDTASIRALSASGVAGRLFRLDAARLEVALARAPREDALETGRNPLVLALPMPDGRLARFAVEESPVLDPVLALRHPAIRTFRAQGVDEPSATARLDWTPHGFHAIVFTSAGTVYVDPPTRGDRAHSVSSFRRDLTAEPGREPFRCLVPNRGGSMPAFRPQSRLDTAALQGAFGTLRRTYRLAVAATGEYTALVGGTVEDALAAVTTTVNRVDGIYERDLAVRLVLIAGEDAILYTDAGTDPYTNGDATAMEGQNQTNLDAVIGSGGYDLGHVFGTSGGGFADAGACVAGQKGKGATGYSAPGTDAYAVDYVSHEIGHQFGALHTYNSSVGSCSGQRDAGSAYEPGSGSTIMAYAGLCGADSLQPHSDDYFHWKSLEEIEAFLAGASCAAQAATGNTPPTVVAGADYAIPADTPFQLTATGTDANGDALTFCWEEADLGAPSPPNTDDGSRPIFRSFSPAPSRTRTFPRLPDLLAGTTTLGESLPTTTRSLTFQVTARDNRAGGGGTNSDVVELAVRSDAGPFAVTQPNTAVTWTGGSLRTVTWSVANTSAAPISCTRVRILLSIDGGQTFPYVLALNTPNDGSQAVVAPYLATSAARVKVQALANVFFDLSDANFTLDPGQPLTLASAQPTSGPAAAGTALTLTGTGFVAGATVRVGGVLASGVSVGGPTSATATTPTVAPGTLNDVLIRDPDATTATLSKAFFADFSDVPAAHLFHGAVERIFRAGITSGCGGGGYCPDNPVTRAEMAIFLLRGEHGPGYAPPPATGTVFSDVPTGAFGAAFIEQLAAEGITSGCGGGKFCPGDPVTREQMAKFLLKAEHGGAFLPQDPTGLFSDVSIANPFARWIEQLYFEGITFGCGGSKFCPSDANTRGQMAAFLAKTFALP